MKYLIIPFLALSFLFVACGDDSDKPTVEALPLKTAKQELSYLMGADMAHSQLDGDPKSDSLNKEELAKGFEIGLNDPKAFGTEAQKAIQDLLGPDGQQFNTQHLDAASLSIGKAIGASFNDSWTNIKFISEFDKKYLVYGFKLALYDQDTLIKPEIKQKMMSDFMTKVNTRISSEVSRVETVFFDKVRKIKGIQELAQGMYLETVKAGSGPSPAISDDVLANYVLMNTNGDTIQSSLGSGPVPFNLGAVIPGWSIGIPSMKKGGKYKLYVPQNMGYGAEGTPDRSIPPFATLVFYVELIDIGKAGTLTGKTH